MVAASPGSSPLAPWPAKPTTENGATGGRGREILWGSLGGEGTLVACLNAWERGAEGSRNQRQEGRDHGLKSLIARRDTWLFGLLSPSSLQRLYPASIPLKSPPSLSPSSPLPPSLPLSPSLTRFVPLREFLSVSQCRERWERPSCDWFVFVVSVVAGRPRKRKEGRQGGREGGGGTRNVRPD